MVHLAGEEKPADPVVIGLVPQSLGLDPKTHGGVKHKHSTAESPHAIDGIRQESGVTRRSDQLKRVLLPCERMKRRRDRHIVFDFFRLMIQYRCAILNLPQPLS